MVAAASIVTVGRWTRDEPLSARVVVGAGFLVVLLALLSNVSEELAGKFAQVVLLVAAFYYVPWIAYNAGLVKQRPPTRGPWGLPDPERPRGGKAGRRNSVTGGI